MIFAAIRFSQRYRVYRLEINCMTYVVGDKSVGIAGRPGEKAGHLQYCERLTTFKFLERLVVQLVTGVVQHRSVVMGIAV